MPKVSIDMSTSLDGFIAGPNARLFDHLSARRFQLEKTRVVGSLEVTHLKVRVGGART